MADVTPYHFPGDTVTCHASAPVVGGTFVAPSGARVDGNYRVATCGAGARRLGVAARDKASGTKVMVIKRGIVGVISAGGLTAGQRVQSDASGRAITLAAGAPAGLCLEDAADGAIALIDLDA